MAHSADSNAGPDQPHIIERLAAVEERLTTIERQLAQSQWAASAGANAADEPLAEAHAEPASADTLLAATALLGRTFLVVAGAFFLRAMTSSETLTVEVGLTLGYAYTIVWLVAADRAGRRGDLLSANFHGVTMTALSLGLIAESMIKFSIFSPEISALVLTIAVTVILLVAVRRNLRPVAWVAVLASTVLLLVLINRAQRDILFGLPLLALALGTTWMGFSKDWRWLRWPTALLADLVFLGALRPPTEGADPTFAPFSPLAVQIIGFLFPAAFFGLFWIIDARGRPTKLFAYVQGILALVIGLTGAANLHQMGMPRTVVAAFALSLGLIAYVWSFIGYKRVLASRFAGVMACLCVILGSLFMPGQIAPTMVMTVAAVVLMLLSHRKQRLDLTFQVASFLVLAIALSGLAEFNFRSLTVSSATELIAPHWWSLLPTGVALVAVAAWAGSAIPDSALGRTVRFLALLALVAGVMAWLNFAIVEIWDAINPIGLGGRHLASTALGSGFAVLLGSLAARHAVPECRWLVVPIQLLIGAKIALFDLKFGSELQLFLSFAAFGLSLILTARQRRGSRRQSGDQDAPTG